MDAKHIQYLKNCLRIGAEHSDSGVDQRNCADTLSYIETLETQIKKLNETCDEEAPPVDTTERFPDQLLKVALDDTKITMTLSLEDLAWLFNDDASNFNGENNIARVMPNQQRAFARKVIQMLLDPGDAEIGVDNTHWGSPILAIFEELLSGFEPDIMTYLEREDHK